MTYEDLRIEARKLGYRLVPIQKKVKLEPCVCKSQLRQTWYLSNGKRYLECKKCGLKSEPGENDREARINWNKMIDNLKEWYVDIERMNK